MKSVLELYGEQKLQEGFQQGFQQERQRGERKRLQELITAINNGMIEEVLSYTMAVMFDVSYAFVDYVMNYFSDNPDKPEEENVNDLVDKVMNGEVSTK